MTGWADTWMLSPRREHPNCMLKWMAWMLTPEVQTQVAEYFGEAPANPKACKYLDAGVRLLRARPTSAPRTRQRPELLQLHRVLEDAAGGLRRRPRRRPCIDYSVWTQKWTRSRAEPESRRRIRGGGRPPVAPDAPGVAMTPAPLPAPPSSLRRRLYGVHLPASLAAGRCCCSTPPLGWFGLVYLGSLVVLFVSAFWYLDPLTSAVMHEFTLKNFQQLLDRPGLPAITLRTVGMAALVTVVDALLAFPLAYYMARVAGPRTRAVLFMLVLLPLWSSYLVRVYSWRMILAEGGPLDWAFELSGSRASCSTRATSPIAIVFSYIWLPYMILPIYAGLERIPSSLLEASADLGARPARRSAGWSCRWRSRPRRGLDLHVLADARRLHHAQLVSNSQFIGNVCTEPGRGGQHAVRGRVRDRPGR